jgi:hypothetical protein
MKAYVEHRSGDMWRVCVGPDASQRPLPYLYAIYFMVKDGVATFEGLDVKLPPSAYKAAIRAIRAMGLREAYERKNSTGETKRLWERK